VAYHRSMSPKPFASSADLAEKEATLEHLAPGVYAFTAQGDPNVGCVIGPEGILAIEARATPFMARRWIDVVRTISDAPFDDLVLTHYHAVRVLGAAAFDAKRIIATQMTADLLDERGQQDWESEQGRMPRLFQGAETIPGLTHPTDTFERSMDLRVGDRRIELRYLGRGHTTGDLVVWLPDDGVLFAGDLVEAQAAPYMGDAHVADWSSTTLDNVQALGAEALVGGRGDVVRGEAVNRAIADTRSFLSTTLDGTRSVRDRGGSLKEAYELVYEKLAPRYAGYPIFDHTMPFNIQRTWDELDGIDHPRIWTAERDRQVWDALAD
jgi:glyoxylase-like metal-dependent hydrolase (beta-lactamase superfamily II)